MPFASGSTPASPASLDQPARGAQRALLLLLLINLFNYVDRQVLAAVEPQIEKNLHVSEAKMGTLATAFLLSYMLISPIFGWLADRTSRWLLIAVGVILWSLASGASGLAAMFVTLLLTRCFVGVGEAAYGPVAPTILSDLYPVAMRGKVLAWFYMAIPVGSALGYALGGLIGGHYGWRVAFFAVVPPGFLLGLCALLMKEPRRGQAEPALTPHKTTSWRDYLPLFKNPSYLIDTAGMTAMTFAIGGIAFWMPKYIVVYRHYGELGRVNTIFGIITVIAGLLATLLGGMAGDALRPRFPGSYFLVSAAGLLCGFPMFLLVLHTPFPTAWIFMFLAVFCLFFNTGPSNTILANVTHPSVRATAFALNILIIHAFGDAISPPVIGWLSERWSMDAAFTIVAVMMVAGGLFWLWGAKYLERDTAVAAIAPVGSDRFPADSRPRL
jgi:predicted MFS family arabinose efflux permease